MFRNSTIIWFQLEDVGEPEISSPLAFAEGLFYFMNYFPEKEGFLEFIIVYKNLK